MDMLPDEESATEWFEAQLWSEGQVLTRLASHAKVPNWCMDCHSYFSADGHRSGTVEDPPAEVGHRDLPGNHQPEELLQHEAAPRSRSELADRLVRAASYPGG